MFDEAPNGREGKLFQEVLQVGEDGLLSDPEQMRGLIHDLSKQLGALVKSPILRLELGEAGVLNVENLAAILHALTCPATAERMRRMGVSAVSLMRTIEAVTDEEEPDEIEREGVEWPQPPSDLSRIILN